jgi:hypothetical protein
MLGGNCHLSARWFMQPTYHPLCLGNPEVVQKQLAVRPNLYRRSIFQNIYPSIREPLEDLKPVKTCLTACDRNSRSKGCNHLRHSKKERP